MGHSDSGLPAYRMIERLKDWFMERLAGDDKLPETHSRPPGGRKPPRAVPRPKPAAKPKPDLVEVDTHVSGRIEDNGPGKNVLIRNRYVREDTGTHESLKILDDSVLDTGEESGIDPYNTGRFDRSRNWDKRFRN